MPTPLARLRPELDFFPSPAADHPGLFIRDPFRYSSAMLIVPPLLVECLGCFDGSKTELDLRAALVRLTGQLDVSTMAQHLIGTLSEAGFLEDESFAAMREEKRTRFAVQAVREPAHAGAAYPAEPEALRQTMARYMDGVANGGTNDHGGRKLAAIAAPHVSPDGGWRAYRAAYSALGPEQRGRTFVILATSHYGRPETFGLTRKNFRTPLGEAVTDRRLVDWLEARAGKAVEMEDYCHSFEHSAELQVLFLQHVLGPEVSILPVLCGSFARSLLQGGAPEDDGEVKRFIEALGELQDRESNLLWVLGVDMAHMGARYADPFTARAGEGPMAEVEQRDRQRIAAINSSDAEAFWELVRPHHDDLKWCGSSPFYTFLKAVPGLRGDLLDYQQWNIDDGSVVSFAGMSFSR